MANVDRELAKMLYPKAADVVAEGLGSKVQTAYVYGTALADSEDGTVTVSVEGDAMGVDAGLEVPTSNAISEGDRVLVSINGNVPVEAVSAGSGDVTRAIASEAQAVADATNQHFWTDTSGIHVTEVDQETFIANPQGANQLSNSQGILLRDGTTVLASFTPTQVQIGKSSGKNIQIGTGGTTFNSSGNAVLSISSDSTLSDIKSGANSGMVLGADVDAANYSRITMQNNPYGTTASVGMNTANNGQTGSVRFINSSGTCSLLVNEQSPIAIDTVQVTVPSTAAGSNYSSSAIDVTKNGYTPAGVLQTWWSAGSGQNKFNDYGTHTEGSNLYVRLWNAGTGAANGTLKASILYVKTELL